MDPADPWGTLGVHVVAAKGARGARVGGGVTVRSLVSNKSTTTVQIRAWQTSDTPRDRQKVQRRPVQMWCEAPLLALAYSGFPNTLWREFHEKMPTPARDTTLDIRMFGAVGDGVTDNTRAFNAAMSAVRASGRSVAIVVPAGTWLTAPFNLTSHLTLNITSGATLLATDDENQWPVIAPLPSYGQGRDHVGPRRTSFLHGVRLQDLVLTGGGTVDGQGEGWWARHLSGAEGNVTRGRLFEVENSDGILLESLTLTNSPFWTVHPTYSSNIVARRLNISNPLDRYS